MTISQQKNIWLKILNKLFNFQGLGNMIHLVYKYHIWKFEKKIIFMKQEIKENSSVAEAWLLIWYILIE